MILDDKVMMRPILVPPPAYHIPSQSSPSISSSSSPSKPNLSTLPSHILLQILHRTFPQSSRIPDQDIPELQRKTLYWLSTSLRLVNRALYTACMHILRSTYLRAYQALLRPFYSSDPFPISTGLPAYEQEGSHHQQQPIPDDSPLQTIQRETLILDRFITLKVREDVFSDDSSLHLEGDDKFRDLFNLAQPQARLEDLVRIYGVREGVISVPVMHPTTGRSRIYPSSLTSSSQSSFQPSASPFHDSNAITVIPFPLLSPTQAPVFTPQFPNVFNTSPNVLKKSPPPPPTPPPRSSSFFSTLKKLTSGSSSSPTSSSPLSPSSPTPLSPSPLNNNNNNAVNPNIFYPPPNSIKPLLFSSLSIRFTFQSIRLIRRTKDGSMSCVAEIPRSRGGTPGVVAGVTVGGARMDTLEALAEGLVRALKEGLEERRGHAELS